MHDIRKLITNVLEKGYLMSLATVDSAGPWVADVIYIFDEDLNIYWMSNPHVRHSQALLQAFRVAGSITVSGPRENNLGIQFAGVAKKIDGPRHDLAVKHYRKRGKPDPTPEQDVLEGDSWYMLKPTSIELIHEELFDFKKQRYVPEDSL